MVSGVSWRGRQQQIISLQQKISDLQLKLKEALSTSIGDQETLAFQQTNGAGDADISMMDMKYNGSIISNGNASQRHGLVQQERKKYRNSF